MLDSVAEKIMTVIASTMQIPREAVHLDSSFSELGINSLDAVTILNELEIEFNISIPDEEIQSLRTVRQTVEGLRKLLKGAATAAPSE